jgi:acetylornithine/succinyldiaminopimelate/putrescine aminotransferase
MLPGFSYAPFGDIEALRALADSSTCAVMLEPVQGEGGVLTPPDGYLKEVADLCRQRDLLLILDEIQTGLGRTGYDFAFRHYGIKPDILTLGKALGSGFPVGAVLSAEEPSKSLGPGTHSTTVGGAPLAMGLSLELIKRILAPGFLSAVRRSSEYFLRGLNSLIIRFPKLVLETRGLGLLLGLVLSQPAGPVSAALREQGFLVNATASVVLRFVPPLTVTEGEIDLLITALAEALKETYPDGC